MYNEHYFENMKLKEKEKKSNDSFETRTCHIIREIID